jgi:hypothetical protein
VRAESFRRPPRIFHRTRDLRASHSIEGADESAAAAKPRFKVAHVSLRCGVLLRGESTGTEAGGPPRARDAVVRDKRGRIRRCLRAARHRGTRTGHGLDDRDDLAAFGRRKLWRSNRGECRSVTQTQPLAASQTAVDISAERWLPRKGDNGRIRNGLNFSGKVFARISCRCS